MEFGVETDGAIRYPDVVVEPPNLDAPEGRRAEKPIIIVEVLSPSSYARDFVEKCAEYQTIASLEAYIVASQDEPICWHWQRQPDATFPRYPEEIAGREASIELKARAIALPMSEIYADISTT